MWCKNSYFLPYVRSNSTDSNVLYFTVWTGWYQSTRLSRSIFSRSLSDTFFFECDPLLPDAEPLAVFDDFGGVFCSGPPLLFCATAFCCCCCSDILNPTLWSCKSKQIWSISALYWFVYCSDTFFVSQLIAYKSKMNWFQLTPEWRRRREKNNE